MPTFVPSYSDTLYMHMFVACICVMCAHVHGCMYVHGCCMYICAYVRMYVYVCIYMWMKVCSKCYYVDRTLHCSQYAFFYSHIIQQQSNRTISINLPLMTTLCLMQMSIFQLLNNSLYNNIDTQLDLDYFEC